MSLIFKQWPDKEPKTNWCLILIEGDADVLDTVDVDQYLITKHDGYYMFAQTDKELINPREDTSGFSAWIIQNKETLSELEPGYYYYKGNKNDCS